MLKHLTKFCLFWLFTCAIAVNSSAQNFTISGILTDKESNEVLIGAYVFCPQTGMGSVTNNYGYYSINIPYGTKNIIFMNEGYFAQIDTTRISSNMQIDVGLRMMQEDDIQIDPFYNIDVVEEKTNIDDTSDAPKKATIKNKKQINDLIDYVLKTNFKIIDRVDNGLIEVPGLQISRMPSLAGEIDAGRSIKFLPGVTPGTELTNGIYIRGGSQDQNLVLIDGVPIYNMNHAFGFYSIFNSDAINHINVTKSGFSARHGGRLSGITDVVQKEGNSKGIHGIFLNSLVAFTLNLDGPLSRDGRTTFAISARRSHWDLFFLRAVSSDSNKLIYTFYDFNAKVCHRIDNKNKLFFSVYSNRDRFYTYDLTRDFNRGVNYLSEFDYDIRWGNFAGSFKWNRMINQKLFSNVSLSYSQYKSQIGVKFGLTEDSAGIKNYSSITYKYFNYIKDMTAKVDYDYQYDRKNTIKFGAAYSLKSLMPGATKIDYVNNGVNMTDTFFGDGDPFLTNEIVGYVEDEIALSSNSKLAIGSRFVFYNCQDQSYVFAEPRVSFNSKINNRYAFKASYTVMHQTLNLLADNINSNLSSVSYDRWIPVFGTIKPSRAQQITLGITQPFKNNVELSIEGYYKWYNNLVEVKEGEDITGGLLTSNEFQNSLLFGKGWNYGVEAFLHKRRGNFTGWIGYTLSWARRNTPGINRDDNYYYQFDRRHYLNMVGQFKFNETYSGSINIVFSTGNLQSVPIGKYLDINGNVVYDYTEKNNYRLPNTIRFDIGLTKVRDQSWGTESGYRFSIYNALARINPAYVYIDNSNVKPQAYLRGFLGFIPGVTYYLKF